MSVIGYDGRLRPASRALQVGAPNEFSPDMVAKIGDAQPKHAELFMKLANQIGDDMVRYGSALEAKQKRADALSDQEAVQEGIEAIDAQRRVISEDDTLTPEQKKEAASRIGYAYEPTGDEMRDRNIALQLRRATVGAANSIYNQVRSIEVAGENAKFSAMSAQTEAEVGAEFNRKLPEILSADSLDKATGGFKTFSDGAFSKYDADIPARLKPQWEAKKAVMRASMFANFSNAYRQRELAMAKENINLTASAAVNADNVDTAINAASLVYDSADAQMILTPLQRATGVSGTALANSERRANDAMQAINTAKNAKVKAASAAIAAGERGAYNQTIADANKDIVAGYDKIIEDLERSKQSAMSSIERLNYLTDEQIKGLQLNTETKFDKMIEDVKQRKVNAVEVFRKEVSTAKQEVGRAVFDEVKNFEEKGTTPVNQMSFDLIKMMHPNRKPDASGNVVEDDVWENLKQRHGVTSGNDNIALAYARKQYGDLNDAEAIETLVQNFIYEIASLDVSANGAEDASRLQELLLGAIGTFGEYSNSYARIAKFASGNIRKEKRNDFSESKFLQYALGEDWEKKKKKLKRGDFVSLWNLVDMLKEVPKEGDQFEKALENAALQFKRGRAYRRIGGISDIKRDIGQVKNSLVPNGASATSKAVPGKRELDSKMDEIESEAEKEADKAELELLESGNSVDSVFEVRDETKKKYWQKRLKDDFGIDNVDGSAAETRYFFEARNRQRHEREYGDSEERNALKGRLKDAGMSLNRRDYTSWLSFGGHPVKGTGRDVHLGMNIGDRDELSISEMRYILERVKALKNRIDPKGERIKQLKASLGQKSE